MSNSMPDNVFETTTTTGTGAYTPAGAVTGSRTFLAALGSGTVHNVQYVCRDDNNVEVGIGTWNGSTLTRDTILYSTNSNAAVNWGTGTRNLFVTISSEICLKELAVDVASTGTPITALDHTGCLTVRITGSTATTIQGIAAPKGSKLLLIQSPSTAVVTLKHQNTSASSADRMILPGATDYIIPAGSFALFSYDITQSRWVEVVMAIVNAQIVPTSIPSAFKKLKISVSSNTAIAVTLDKITLASSTEQYLASAVSVTINTGTSGANGLDTGSIANSTGYYVWIIYNETTVAGLLSTSATSPTMPSGYTYKARVGWVRTNGSANLYRTIQYDRWGQWIVDGSLLTGLPVLGSGSSGNINTPTWTACAWSAVAPATASQLRVVLAGVGVSFTAMAAPNNSYGGLSSTSNPPPLKVSNSSTLPNIVGDFVLESSDVYYACDGANGRFVCLGWEDTV